MNGSYKEKAIPMISVDPNTGKYVFEEEAIQFLRSVPGPIGVISVAGLYRTGKSYLLNRMLLNRSNGFGVGPTVNPCTKGLWCWGTPLKGQTSEGEPINIIVIDTEGIGALDEDQTHDTRIFTLAILASSCFIYNSVGSIDETAIQSLSLVVNLTKHIHLKTQSKSEEETDPDEFANFFPSFYWVVRDFALQLIDSGGDAINSKEYLEKALAPQKGFTDDVEEKNRIRRLLTTFFKERECFTLIRPCLDEEKLRVLDKLSFDDLRAEFVEQVMNFRKRVVNRMKPKMINNKKLSGQMYFSLMRNYVGAINDGAVPNIENAWNYMCKEQCHKISAEAYDMFETRFKEALSLKMPCPEEDFNGASQYAEDQAEEFFKKKAFGDNIDEFLRDLKKKIKAKIQSVKVQNEKESMGTAHNFIVRNFSSIEKKLKLQEFKSYSEFEKEMAGLYGHVLENGPKLPNCKLVYLEFMRKVLPQGADFFFRASENEFEKIRTITAEREKNYDREIKQLREELSKDRKSNSEKVNTLDREKVDLTMKVEKLSEDLERTTKDKEQEINRLNRTLETRQQELESLKKSMQQKVLELNDKNEEINLRLVSGEKEWEKEKAILDLKVKQLTQQSQELQKKEKATEQVANSSKNEFNFQLKESTLKFEKRVAELTLELNEYKEKSTELSEELKQVREDLENTRDKYEKREKKNKEELTMKAKELEKMKLDWQLDRNRMENDCELSKQQVTKEYRELTENFKRQEITLKTLNDQLKAQKATSDKDYAILQQKHQFAEESIRDLKQQITEMKANHQATIAAMEETNGKLKEESQNQRFIEIKSKAAQELKNAESEWESCRKKMQFDLENFGKAKNDLELKVSLLENTLAKEKSEWEGTQKKSDEKIEALTNEINSVERNKNGKLREQEVFFENKIKELERELEQITDRSNNEQRESHTKSEEAITQMKNYYELEKDKLESKLTLEKEKAEKKYKKMVEEYEQKHKDEISQLEDENEQMRDEFMSMETGLQTTINQLQHDNDMKSKQLDNLEKGLAELKETSAKREHELNAKYESLSQSTRAEKDAQYQKIEQLQTENNKKEKTIMSLSHLKEQLTTSLEKREAAIEDLKREAADLKASFEKASEDLKKRYQELSSEYLEKKIGYEKSIALAGQEKEFLEKKVKEQSDLLQNQNKNNEERLRNAKEDASSEIRSQFEKFQSERNQLEQKYQKLKKSSRETETILQKQIVELDKEKAIDQEKHFNLQQKLKDIQMKRTAEVDTLNSQLSTLRESVSSDKRALQAEIDKLRSVIGTLENEKSEVTSNYEKDRILWENKVNYLEQQKEQTRNETAEKIRRMENNIETLQRSRVNDKTSSESQHNEYVSKIQKKYLQQISEMNESNTKKTMEYEANVKELDLQLKNLNEKYILDIHTKMGNQAATEKRLTEVIESEKRLQTELDRLRVEKEQRSTEFQKQLDQQKENMKTKMRELEQRLKLVENQKRNEYFQHEKQKAKWKFEEEHRSEKMESLQEQITKNSYELEKLQRENERLKAERKTSKATGMQSFLTSKWTGYGAEQRRMNKVTTEITQSNLATGEFNLLTQDDEQSTNKENMGSTNQP